MEYLLDTNVLIHLLRNDTLGQYVENTLKVLDKPNIAIISVVSLGEIQSIAMQRAWGDNRLMILANLLTSFVIADIHSESIVERYAEIDTFSQGKHPTLPLSASARNMGKNDIWIAATASVLKVKLLTTDNDFNHLNPTFLEIAEL